MARDLRPSSSVMDQASKANHWGLLAGRSVLGVRHARDIQGLCLPILELEPALGEMLKRVAYQSKPLHERA